MRSQRSQGTRKLQAARFLPLVMLLAYMALGCDFPVTLLDSIASTSSATTQAPTTPATTVPSPTTTSDLSSPTASPPFQTLPQDVLSQMETIEAQVTQLRGLQSTSPTHRVLLTEDEMQRTVMDVMMEGYSPQEAEDDARVMALMGFLEPGFDLWTLYLDLYSEQVLGFYNDETEKMTIRSDADFDILARFTYAHEYDHFLQDHAFDFQDDLLYNDAACEGNGDRCLAIQALLEGDAVLLQSQWLRTYASQDEIADLIQITSTIQSPVFSTAPEFFQQSLLFPYDQGNTFVLHFYIRGQWAAVDALFRNPPVSTEQILHPESYPDEIPVVLEVPDLVAELGSEWRLMDRDTLGEWQLKLMLSEYLPGDTADSVAQGWGGDTYIALYDERQDRTALVLIIAWDTDNDAIQYYNAMREYGDTRFTDYMASGMRLVWQTETYYASLMRGGEQTLWILAPDEATEATIRESFTFPVRQQ